MSFANPTGLRVGATGSLHTWKVRIAARLVLGVEIDGETYYWNEFHLVGDSGNDGTLVCEEGDHGPEWKLFRLFEPAQPMTAREAATKRVGDTVNLDGKPTRITLVDQSRVYHIEGKPPEGVQVGDVAHYFNADTGQRMLVASWTGDEIEFYEGEDLPRSMVAKAFDLELAALNPDHQATRTAFTSSSSSRGPAGSRALRNFAFVMLALGVITIFSVFSCARNRPQRTANPPLRQPAPAVKLTPGNHGRLGTADYTVVGASVVEIARISGRRDLREYQLALDGATPPLLVQGLNGGATEWHLFYQIVAPTHLTPHAAATYRKNGWLTLGGGDRAQVTDLFRAHTLSRDTAATQLPISGAIRYGFIARSATDVFVARWDENEVQLLRGVPYAERDILAAFAKIER